MRNEIKLRRKQNPRIKIKNNKDDKWKKQIRGEEMNLIR